MSTTKLLFVRHGQSTANSNDLFAGFSNFDLTELGYLQAQKTAEFIRENYRPTEVIASDLDRAFHTGEAVPKLMGIPITKNKNLREIFAGKWEGAKFSTLSIDFPEEYNCWIKNIGSFCCPEGESMAHLYERIVTEIKKISKENPNKTLVIATHATPIRVFMTYCKKYELGKMHEVEWASNASVTEVDFDSDTEEFSLIGENICSHLADIATHLPKSI